jgi:hypothetical protein
MYVCGWDTLKLQGGRVAKRGDPVPEAETWDEAIRRANLRIGAIIEVKDPKQTHPAKVSIQQKSSPKVKVSAPIAEKPSEPIPVEPELKSEDAQADSVETVDKGQTQKKKRK